MSQYSDLLEDIRIKNQTIEKNTRELHKLQDEMLGVSFAELFNRNPLLTSFVWNFSVEYEYNDEGGTDEDMRHSFRDLVTIDGIEHAELDWWDIERMEWNNEDPMKVAPEETDQYRATLVLLREIQKTVAFHTDETIARNYGQYATIHVSREGLKVD